MPDAKPIIKGWEEEQIKRKKSECEVWWSEYKNNLQEFIRNKVST